MHFKNCCWLDCFKCQISFTFSEDLKALRETEDKFPFEPKLSTTNIKTLSLSQLRQRLTVHTKRAKLKQVSSPATHYFFSELMGLVSLVSLVSLMSLLGLMGLLGIVSLVGQVGTGNRDQPKQVPSLATH